MNSLLTVFCCVIISVSAELTVYSNFINSSLLPPIYHLDPYTKCREEGKNYCKITILLKPLNSKNSGPIWDMIETTNNLYEYYNHTKLYHGICVEDCCGSFNNLDQLKKSIKLYYNRKYKKLGLRIDILAMDCNNYDNNFIRDTYDWSLLTCFGLFIICSCSKFLVDLRHRVNNRPLNPHKFIKPWSMLNNLLNINNIEKAPQFQQLKCIQGVRLYTTLFIIFFHTFCSFIGGYIDNTEYFEHIPNNIVRHTIRNLFFFLVQTFFLISAWLLSYHSFQLFEEKKLKTSKYILLTFVNRFLRIFPTMAAMIALASSSWVYSLFYGPIKEIFSDIEYYRCKKYWWMNILFINNISSNLDMAYFISWYLSADTQLYLLSILILCIARKYKKWTLTILNSFFLLSIMIPAIITYIYNQDFIYRINPRNAELDFLTRFDFYNNYSSTHTNMASYMLGLIFGYVYYVHQKNRKQEDNNNIKEQTNIFDNKIVLTIWWILFLGLPFTVLYISAYRYNRIVSAILSGIIKPMYALGIGIGIFGMSQGKGGIIKKIWEWKPALILSNVTYSTYCAHFTIVFQRTASAHSPLAISDFIFFKAFLQDIISSFLVGTFVYVSIEAPCSQIQNLLIPKLRSHVKSS